MDATESLITPTAFTGTDADCLQHVLAVYDTKTVLAALNEVSPGRWNRPKLQQARQHNGQALTEAEIIRLAAMLPSPRRHRKTVFALLTCLPVLAAFVVGLKQLVASVFLPVNGINMR